MSNEPTQAKPGALIIRSPRNADRPYFSSSRAAAQDENLTYEAGGLLWYLLSKPDDWQVQISDLQKKGAGRDKVYAMLKLLKGLGYITRPKYQGADGRWVWGDYQVHETPQPLTENPDTVKPDTVRPDTAKPEINTKNRGKQKRESNKEKNTESAGADDASIPLIIELWVKGWDGIVSGRPYANKTYRADAAALGKLYSVDEIKRYTDAKKELPRFKTARPAWSIWVNDCGAWLGQNPNPNKPAQATGSASGLTEEQKKQAAEIAERLKAKQGGNP